MATPSINPIKFGTDGWRGIIAADFTFERVLQVAPLAALVLAEAYGTTAANPRSVIVGYDRRFLADTFARAAAEAIQAAGFDVQLADGYAPTPAFSWAAKATGALGAIVMTASHNPAEYLGLKIKGAFGGSVSKDITRQVEARLDEALPAAVPGTLTEFDPWESYCQGLQAKVDVAPIRAAIAAGRLAVIADVMHGAAATGLERLLGIEIQELNGERDPLFGGHPPEPLPKYAPRLFEAIKTDARANPDRLRVGLIFDGDSDRIAAVDGAGNFLSSQVLIPILIDHLATNKGRQGEVVKTLSGSDFIPRIAESYGLPVFETPVGYKYIADRMLGTRVLIGGEESGGIGYGDHIPERDALFSALLVLEAAIAADRDLGATYAALRQKIGFDAAYDRIDLPLASQANKEKLMQLLAERPLESVNGKAVKSYQDIDGYKFRLEDNSWLMVRFSGTEPLLRLYCEAADSLQVRQTLDWAKAWAESI